MFRQFAIALDFTHHRVAFRDTDHLLRPKKSVVIPIPDVGGMRVVPVSVNGAPPAQFECQLGNVSSPLLLFHSELSQFLHARKRLGSPAST
jgi:hypothetical protein